MKDKKHPIYDAAVAIPVNRVAVRVTRDRFHIHYEPNVGRESHPHWDAPPPMKKIIPHGMQNLVGTVFGRFTVLGVYAGTKGHWTAGRWIVRCTCGRYEIRGTKAIKSIKNNWDRCIECQHLTKLKRQEVFTRTGEWPPDENYR